MAITMFIRGNDRDAFYYEICNSALEGLPGYIVEHGSFADASDIREIVADHPSISCIANRARENTNYNGKYDDGKETISQVARSLHIDCPPLLG